MKNIKFHKTFFSLDQNSFAPFLWLFIISILNELKKKYSCSKCKSPPRTSSLLPSSSLPCSSPPPSLLFSHSNLWEKQANSLGPICVHNSRFYCNSCKVVLQQWEIVKRLPWCTHIASYYMLFSGRNLKLLILRVKLTIFIKYLSVAQTVSCVTTKCSNVTWPVILDQCCSSHIIHAHRP